MNMHAFASTPKPHPNRTLRVMRVFTTNQSTQKGKSHSRARCTRNAGLLMSRGLTDPLLHVFCLLLEVLPLHAPVGLVIVFAVKDMQKRKGDVDRQMNECGSNRKESISSILDRLGCKQR
jgi:hypothetical protein